MLDSRKVLVETPLSLISQARSAQSVSNLPRSSRAECWSRHLRHSSFGLDSCSALVVSNSFLCDYLKARVTSRRGLAARHPAGGPATPLVEAAGPVACAPIGTGRRGMQSKRVSSSPVCTARVVCEHPLQCPGVQWCKVQQHSSWHPLQRLQVAMQARCQSAYGASARPRVSRWAYIVAQ